MPATIKAARKALHADVAGAVAEVTADYDHEPRNRAKPVALTVELAGVLPEFWEFDVRLYVQIAADPANAADLRDDVVQKVDSAMSNLSGPSQWSVELIEEEQPTGVTAVSWLCTSRVQVGREDYF